MKKPSDFMSMAIHTSSKQRRLALSTTPLEFTAMIKVVKLMVLQKDNEQNFTWTTGWCRPDPTKLVSSMHKN